VSDPTPTTPALRPATLPPAAQALIATATAHGWRAETTVFNGFHAAPGDVVIHAVTLTCVAQSVTTYWDVCGDTLVDFNAYRSTGVPRQPPTHTGDPAVVDRWVTCQALRDAVRRAS
jgi:hypothetical protein